MNLNFTVATTRFTQRQNSLEFRLKTSRLDFPSFPYFQRFINLDSTSKILKFLPHISSWYSRKVKLRFFHGQNYIVKLLQNYYDKWIFLRKKFEYLIFNSSTRELFSSFIDRMAFVKFDERVRGFVVLALLNPETRFI